MGTRMNLLSVLKTSQDMDKLLNLYNEGSISKKDLESSRENLHKQIEKAAAKRLNQEI